MISRRGLFLGAGALLAAPSIVRAASLMPVSVRPIAIIGAAPMSILPGGVTYLAADLERAFLEPLVGATERLLMDGNPAHRAPMGILPVSE
jgi:hypothetical protein